MSLTKTVGLAGAVIADLDQLIHSYPVDDLADALDARAILGTTAAGLSQIRERLDTLIGDAMGAYQVTVEGKGVVKRHRDIRRRNWQSEDLLRMVLDSRQVDPETGEVESQVDALKNVYGLKGYNASLKALKARGIDPDEWAETEERNVWKLELR